MILGDFPWLAQTEDWDSEIQASSATATTTTTTTAATTSTTTTTTTIADDTNDSDDCDGDFNQTQIATGESVGLESPSTAWGDSSLMSSKLSMVPLLPEHPGLKGEFIFLPWLITRVHIEHGTRFECL